MSNVAESVARRAVAAIVGLFRRPSPGPVAASELHRVLVIRLGSGPLDALAAVPLLRAIREGLPDARLDLLVAEGQAGAFEGLGLAHEVVTYDRRRAFADPTSVPRLVWRLRSVGYDAAVEAGDPSTFSTTQALLLRATGARWRLALDRGEAGRFANVLVAVGGAPAPEAAQMRLGLLGPLGLPPRSTGLETMLGLEPAQRAAAVAVRDGAGAREGSALVVVDSATPAVEPLAAVIEAARRKRETGVLVVFRPGAESGAREFASAVKGARVASAAIDETGMLAALVRDAGLVVCEDGPSRALGLACAAPLVVVGGASGASGGVRVVDRTATGGALKSAAEAAVRQAWSAGPRAA